jgi:hypothetical protein
VQLRLTGDALEGVVVLVQLVKSKALSAERLLFRQTHVPRPPSDGKNVAPASVRQTLGFRLDFRPEGTQMLRRLRDKPAIAPDRVGPEYLIDHCNLRRGAFRALRVNSGSLKPSDKCIYGILKPTAHIPMRKGKVVKDGPVHFKR